MGLSDGRKSFPIGLAVLIQYRSVADTQPASQPRCRSYYAQRSGVKPKKKQNVRAKTGTIGLDIFWPQGIFTCRNIYWSVPFSRHGSPFARWKLTTYCSRSIGHRLNVFVGPRSMYGNLLNTVDRGRHNPTETILWLAEHWVNAFGLWFWAYLLSPASYELEVCDIYVAYV